MSNRTELYVSDTHNDDGAENTNATGVTSGTRRGIHNSDTKTVTPASDTDVAFTHRYMYSGDGGTAVVRFASGGATHSIILVAGGLLPIVVYSIDSFSGSNIVLFN